MARTSLSLTLALALLLAACPLLAQEHPNTARGFAADKAFQIGDVDHVSLYNGNLILTVPIGTTYPVNGGLTFALTLTYNSTVWDFQQRFDTPPGGGSITYTQSIPSLNSNAGLGWMVSLGRVIRREDPAGNFLGDAYLDPDGSTRPLLEKLHAGDPEDAGDSGFVSNFPQTQFFTYSRDSSYLRLWDAGSFRRVAFPDNHFRDMRPSDGRPMTISGRFQNAGLSVDYATPNEWRITDAHGRLYRVIFRTDLAPYAQTVHQVVIPAFGGGTATYQFNYAATTIARHCRHTDPQLGTTVQVPLLTGVTLPDGSRYSMPASDYCTANGTSPTGTCVSQSGAIKRLTLPTLGQIEWTYQNYTFPTGSSLHLFRRNSAGVATRTLKDAAGQALGTWQYQTALEAVPVPQEMVNTVTDPLGNFTKHCFSVYSPSTVDPADDRNYQYGLPFTPKTNDGAGRFLSSEAFNAAGQIQRSTYVRYEHDQVPASATTLEDRSRLNQRLASERVFYRDDPDATCVVPTPAAPNPANICRFQTTDFSDFDGLGHYRTRQTNGNFPGSNVRTTFVYFNPGQNTYGQPNYAPKLASEPWILTVFPFEWTSADGRLEFRSYCYEPDTGFFYCRRIHDDNGSGQTSHDVIEWFDRDVAGNVTAERFYGGDTQAVTVGNVVPLPAAPVYQLNHTYSRGVRATSQYANTSFKVLDLTIDPNTGLPSASRDSAGIEERYGYDAMGRLTTIEPRGDPAIGTDPTDAWTTYTYCTATSTPACAPGRKAEVVVARKIGGAGAELTALRYRFDDWGRLISEEERMPPSGAYVARTFGYNALGWKTFVSEKGAAGGTSYLNFDAFGRPRTVRPADGAGHDVTLSYVGTRQVARTVKVATTGGGAETSATATEVYDRHGRLYEVTEPNGIKTRYDYDTADRLQKVCQNATGAGTATCGQARYFTYDYRGFLLSEQHPEKGSAGNGLVSYFTYDPRGHARRRIDGPNDVTFTFDAAERVTQVRETGGLQRVLKTSTFSSANGASDYRRGKLVSASRFNFIGAPFLVGGQESTAEVRDTYVYGGREGRVSQRDTQLHFNGVAEESFRLTQTYSELGLVSSLGYPDCIAGDCPALDAPRTVGFTHSYGRLVTVPGFTGTATTTGGATVGQITYHANGLVHQVPHANQMLFTQSNDPNGMARPSVYQASRGPTIYWNTGTHAWDGAGNLKGTGEFTYVYDALSRVTQAFHPGSVQSFAYDVYGNIQSITTDASLLNTPTSSSSNRLTSGVYNTAGNLVSWSGNAYEYDAFNQMKRYVSGGEDWRYMYTADDERFWSYRVGGGGSIWSLRGLDGRALRRYEAHLSWGTYEDYVYRDGSLLAAARSPSGEMRHFHLDHLGTPRMVTNQNAGSIGFHRYYPFGKEQTALQEGEVMKFTGHERDLANLAGDGDDLDYMHARHCSPLTGRFLSVDPVNTADPALPQSWNRYAYARGNPLRYVDPTGEDVWDVAIGFWNALGSDLLLGAGRADPPNEDYAFGQAGGDLAAAVTGVLAMESGLSAFGLGSAATVFTSGTGSPVTLPVAAAGAAEAAYGAGVTLTATTHLMESAGSDFDTRGLEKQLAAHEQRLEAYRRNPDAHDNKGHLARAGNDQALRKKIIEARIKKLENQIKNFRRLIAKLKGGGGGTSTPPPGTRK